MKFQFSMFVIVSLCLAGCVKSDSSSDGSAAPGNGQSGPAMKSDGSMRMGGGGRGGPGGSFDPAAMFERRDADGDGKLSGDEISERMRGNLEEIDTDKDGAVALEEFQTFMSQMRARGGMGGGRGMGGGGRGMGGRGRGMGGPGGGFDPVAFFQRADGNGDGQLTENEIPGRMRGDLDQIDTNKGWRHHAGRIAGPHEPNATRERTGHAWARQSRRAR
jgi:hypothetical protein